ncbi:MAG: hypothetical protein DRQ48_11755 [Gammaproteobacteria bacterium]|nr:MAG: hypothetical protein DRQ48_11755 [Gammaproteobacteria bacterium]
MGSPLSGSLALLPGRRELPAVPLYGHFSAEFLELIEKGEHLPGDVDQAGPSLANLAVLLGHPGKEGQGLASQGEVAQSISTSVGEHGGDVEFPAGAAAVGLTALSLDVVDQSPPEGRSFDGALHQVRDLFGQEPEAFSKVAGRGHLCLYIGSTTQILAPKPKNFRGSEIGEEHRWRAGGRRWGTAGPKGQGGLVRPEAETRALQELQDMGGSAGYPRLSRRVSGDPGDPGRISPQCLNHSSQSPNGARDQLPADCPSPFQESPGRWRYD